MAIRKRRWAFWLLLAISILVARPIFYVSRAIIRDRDNIPALAPDEIDDAGRLNKAKIAELWPIPSDPDSAVNQLRQLLKRAHESKTPVSIAGARHSMGGHTIAPGGIVIDTVGFRRMEYDEKTELLTVGSGALWADIIPYLNERGKSVMIMQSNDSFTVGGSLSVNCHGWQTGKGPFIDSVDSFRIMLADGNILNCSRSENRELFSHAAGGYGLFGIILDVKLRVVSNVRYRVERIVCPAEKYESEYQSRVDASDAELAFGRLCVVPGKSTFLKEAILTSFHPDPGDGQIPPLKEVKDGGLTRAVYRASIGSDYGKGLRWDAEKNIGTTLYGRYFSRNQVLHTSVERLRERSAERVDILHEAFIPKGKMNVFLEQLRQIIPKHDVDLLNITVRSVNRDEDTALRYGNKNMFAFVMLFSQASTQEADAKLAVLTAEIIEMSLALEGGYYLPYRLHASPELFRRAYPQADDFFIAKRKFDPKSLFQNAFYHRYGLGMP